eukprot:8822600-Alexandrium_andersonii.AAC.1
MSLRRPRPPKSFKPRNIATVYREVRDGRARITGGPGLKETEHYTTEFADAVVDAKSTLRATAPTFDEQLDESDENEAAPEFASAWETGHFESVLHFLHGD